MTREEAISLLYDMKDTYDEIHENTNYEIGYEQMTALDMAIEALSEPRIVRCKDCKHRSDGGWCDVYIQPRMDTDFCNHGERQCNYFGERREP